MPRADPASERYYCGCLTCIRENVLWRRRSVWYQHKRQREAQQDVGDILPPDPRHAKPTKSSKKIAARRPRQRPVNDEEDEDMDVSLRYIVI